VPDARPAGVYVAVGSPVDTDGGGLAVPKYTSKLVALPHFHESIGLRLTFIAPFDGCGEFGLNGTRSKLLPVEKVQIGPDVEPPALWATIRQ
jgi:hypothetical protein